MSDFRGAAQGGIGKSFAEKVVVPLPPLDEQRRIVDILSRVESVRRLRDRANAALRALVPALFVRMFGDHDTIANSYPVMPLSAVADIGSGATKGRKLEGAETVQVPYLRVANVQDGHLDLSEIKTIEMRRDEIEKYALRPGDMVMTEGGDPDKLGRGALWTGQLEYCAHQNHVFRVRLHSNLIRSEYLKELVASRYGKAYFLTVAKQTTGIASINKTQLGAFPVPVPPISKQERFARLVSAASGLIETADTSAATASSLSAALLSRLFGEAA